MPSPSRLSRLAHWCATHRALTVLAWLLFAAVVTVAAALAPAREVTSLRLPGTESQTVYDLLDAHTPADNADTDQVVLRARSGTLRDRESRRAVADVRARLARQPLVARVSDPLAAGSRASADGRTAVMELTYVKVLDDGDAEELAAVEAVAFSARGPALQVEHGGPGAQIVRLSGAGGSELVGLGAAGVVLLITFGSLVAAGMPLLTALFALVTAVGGITLVSHLVDTPDFATDLASLIGIGVGVDYALFVITRYRDEVAGGRERIDAIAVATATAGRTVLLAGSTVIVALLGLLLLGLSFMQGVAIGASLMVALSVLATLTLLPALLAVAGRRIEPRRRRHRPAPSREGVLWERWSRAVQRRPKLVATLSLALLLALCAPALGLRLGTGDAGLDPRDSTTYRSYAMTSEAFGAGANGTFLLATELPRGAGERGLTQLTDAVAATPGIAAAGAPVQSADGAIATLTAQPTTAPGDPETARTLARLREDVLPRVAERTGLRAGVGGLTAADADVTSTVGEKLPLFVGVVVLLSAVLLLMVFGSVVIPIKAAAMNLLSIGAALGVVTAIFQYGVGADLLGVGTGPIMWFLPVLLFAIVFGLSMDYEVFLLSRVHEEWERHGNASDAVARGLASTGRVITAAATIMVVVFGSFALGDDRLIKLFGVGLASAILIDAVIIRCLLVPALMELLGDRAWWMPAWLRRRVPTVQLERPGAAAEAGSPA